jgi:hypothetical protein
MKKTGGTPVQMHPVALSAVGAYQRHCIACDMPLTMDSEVTAVCHAHMYCDFIT